MTTSESLVLYVMFFASTNILWSFPFLLCFVLSRVTTNGAELGVPRYKSRKTGTRLAQ